MKKVFGILIYLVTTIVLILACSKDVGLFTEVEFQIVEQHNPEGYVNESIPTTITVIPEEQLPDYEYFFSYSVINGEGHFEDADGSILPKGENIPLNPLSASIQYKGTSTGSHILKIRAEDNFGFTEEIELAYTINEIPIVWTATSPVVQIAPGDTATITVTLDSGANISNTTYERNYSITSGTGSIAQISGGDVVLGEFIPIELGVYQYSFVSDTMGSVIIAFDLRDSNGQVYAAEVKFEVMDIISVTDVNVTPSFVTLVQGSTQQLDVIFTPSDATNQEMTWESNNPAVATVDTNGLVTAVSEGIAIITGTSVDNTSLSDTSDVTVTAPANEPPTANDFSASVLTNSSNNTIDVGGEISDPENDALTVSIQAGSPANGSATISGTIINYTPNNGFTGNDLITYLVSDGNNPAVSGVITVTVDTVENLPPTANSFSTTVDGNSSNNPIDVAGEIADPENDSLTISIQGSGPANGSATISGTIISYTPNNGFTGNDLITYLVSDGNNPAVSAVITITVDAAENLPPTANDFSTTVIENSTNNPIDVAGEISDPENDPLIVSLQGSPANGTATISGTVINYIPNNGYTGNDLITYLVSDGNNPAVSATITVGVNGLINQPPSANDFTTSVLENSTNNPIDVDGEISDPENDPLTVSLQGSPANGVATISGTVISYTPDNGFTGNDVITYLVSDGNNPAVSATITVGVSAVINQPPTANDFGVTVMGNSTNNSIDVASEISDPENDPLTVSIQGSPVNGLATISGTIITYAPINGFTGNDLITYLVSDGNNPAVSATITITVTAVVENLPPTANDFAVTVIGNSTNNSIDVANEISDPENDPLTVSIQGSPANGTATILGTVISYTPNNGFTGNDLITYFVSDGNNPLVAGTITVTVNAPANIPPVAMGSASPQTGSAPLTVNFKNLNSTDSDGIIVGTRYDFGDLTSSNGGFPFATDHTYDTQGTYTARMTVTDDDGATDFVEFTIVVGPTASPIATFSNGSDIDTGTGPTSVSGTLTISNGPVAFRVTSNLTSQQSGEGELPVVFTIVGQGSWIAFSGIGNTNVTTDTPEIPAGTYDYILEFESPYIGFGFGSVRKR